MHGGDHRIFGGEIVGWLSFQVHHFSELAYRASGEVICCKPLCWNQRPLTCTFAPCVMSFTLIFNFQISVVTWHHSIRLIICSSVALFYLSHFQQGISTSNCAIVWSRMNDYHFSFQDTLPHNPVLSHYDHFYVISIPCVDVFMRSLTVPTMKNAQHACGWCDPL